MLKELKPGFMMMLVMTVLTGLVYPAVITGISQVVFRDQADGSNPGRNYIRAALVQDENTTDEALRRLVAVLG